MSPGSISRLTIRCDLLAPRCSITLTFADALKTNVMLLPMGRGDDGAHSINEKLDRSNYIQGSILLGEYLSEIPNVA